MCNLVTTSNRKEILCQIYLLMHFAGIDAINKTNRSPRCGYGSGSDATSLQKQLRINQLKQTGLTVTVLFLQQFNVFMPSPF